MSNSSKLTWLGQSSCAAHKIESFSLLFVCFSGFLFSVVWLQCNGAAAGVVAGVLSIQVSVLHQPGRRVTSEPKGRKSERLPEFTNKICHKAET